jgi:hypothetical protein
MTVAIVSVQLIQFDMANMFLLLSQLLLQVSVRLSDIRMTKQSPVPCVAPESIVTLHSRVTDQSRAEQSRAEQSRAELQYPSASADTPMSVMLWHPSRQIVCS